MLCIYPDFKWSFGVLLSHTVRAYVLLHITRGGKEVQRAAILLAL